MITTPADMNRAKIYEFGFEAECPECNGPITRVKIFIPVADIFMGRVPVARGYPFLEEERGEVFSDCAKGCCLKWLPFRAYLRAYNSVLYDLEGDFVTTWFHRSEVKVLEKLNTEEEKVLTAVLSKPSKGELL